MALGPLDRAQGPGPVDKARGGTSGPGPVDKAGDQWTGPGPWGPGPWRLPAGSRLSGGFWLGLRPSQTYMFYSRAL